MLVFPTHSDQKKSEYIYRSPVHRFRDRNAHDKKCDREEKTTKGKRKITFFLSLKKGIRTHNTTHNTAFVIFLLTLLYIRVQPLFASNHIITFYYISAEKERMNYNKKTHKPMFRMQFIISELGRDREEKKTDRFCN